MTSITQGSNTTSFAYDAAGRRVSRTASGTTTAYQYAGDAVLLEKQGSTTSATYSYGNALRRKDGEYPLCDGLGSARAETSGAQAVTFTLNADAFGNTVATTGSTASSYQFAATSGYRNDGDAGLFKVGCRYYDPQTGTFTSRDTYLDQKTYLYCEHDPVNAVDPSGHMSCPGPHGLPKDKNGRTIIPPPTEMTPFGKWVLGLACGYFGQVVAVALLPEVAVPTLIGKVVIGTAGGLAGGYGSGSGLGTTIGLGAGGGIRAGIPYQRIVDWIKATPTL